MPRLTNFDPIYMIARWLRPGLEKREPLQRMTQVTDVWGVVCAAPLMLVGLGWLVTRTDLALVGREWLNLAWMGAAMLALNGLSFFTITYMGTGGGSYEFVQTTLTNLAKWSAVFIFGPTALWLDVALNTATLIYNQRVLQTADQRWSLARNLLSALATSSLFPLITLSIYQMFGGTFPPGEVSLRMFVLGAGVGLIELLLELLMLWVAYLGYSLQSLKKLGLMNRQTAFSTFFLLVLGMGVPYIAGVFAILLAGVYAQHGLLVYLLFVLAGLLVALMGRQLGHSMEESRTRALQIEKLEAMGRAILNAPPDTSTLADILKQYAVELFTMSRMAIWVLPERMLLKQPQEWPGEEFARTQAWVSAQSRACAFTSKDALPWRAGSEPHPPVVAAPVLDAENGQTIGGAYVELMNLGRTWNAKALAGLLPTLQSLAAQVASALQQARIYERTLAHQKTQQELALARRIQTSFLPASLPQVPGWELAASLEPAREMSGDFYDLIPLSGGRLGVLIADVTDKGVGPALFMALSRTLIRTYAVQFKGQPEEVLRAANRRMLQDAENPLFVTTFYGVLNPQSGEFVYANAGHNPPLFFKAGEMDPELLIATGMPLGVDAEMSWGRQVISIAAGDTVVLYTDGVTEAQNSLQVCFELERLVSSVRERVAQPVVDLHSELLSELRAFIGGAPQSDDITLVVVKRILG
ncbi:MAG: PP2C family protein-serine/threonine phosphatase [Anaerolineales bacterium]|nr:PP2C family protein-serine/threonine phosphatase [Anaerolineales bacterium]